MIIAVPRERKTLEKRIAITPEGASELTKHGHTVLIEKNAGVGSFFEDSIYEKAGCEIVDSLEELWKKADLIVKVKEPHEEEFQYFRPGLIIFDYLHLASLPDVANAMLKGKVTGIAYELVQTLDRRLPLLEPMSEVAGKLSVLNGSHFLLSHKGGRGVLLGGTTCVAPGEVVILGAGVAGRSACEIAIGMGAQVSVFDIDATKLERLKMQFGNRVKTLYSTKGAIEKVLPRTDILIGSVLIPGAAAPKIVTRDMIKLMPKGSVFVDISIDQGGCAETIRTTSLENPTYVEEGVVHYGVPNMPAQTPRTSTLALTAATLPYIITIADNFDKVSLSSNGGLNKIFDKRPELRGALNTLDGKLTNKAVGEALGIKSIEI